MSQTAVTLRAPAATLDDVTDPADRTPERELIELQREQLEVARAQLAHSRRVRDGLMTWLVWMPLAIGLVALILVLMYIAQS